MSHVIKMIDIIFPDRFRNISSYINKVVIKHICHVPRIHMDKASWIIFFTVFSTLRFFVLMMLLMIRKIRYISLFPALNLCS